jgi:nucleotide-binding universal stress UspA family protein
MDPQRNRRAVVVGVDGSGYALRAARWAAAEAARRGAPLRWVNALGAAEERLPHTMDAGHYRVAVRRTARDLVADAARAALAREPGVVIEQRTSAGSAIDVLRAESAAAQLLVVGDRGQSRLEGLLAGSVAVAMTTTAACPMVVVHAGAADPPTEDARPVVVGVDGSATSEAATEFAFVAAATRGVPLVAVHTWWDPLAGLALTPVLDLDAFDAGARELLFRRLAGWREKYPEVEVATSVGRDHPAHALLQHAARAQLLVVGSRGRRRAGRAGAGIGQQRRRAPVAVPGGRHPAGRLGSGVTA